jgi:hypothetical protein
MRKASPPIDTLADLVPQREWVATRGARVFETFAQWEWFVRTHPEIRRSIHWHALPRGVYFTPGIEADVLALLGVSSFGRPRQLPQTDASVPRKGGAERAATPN